MYGWDKLTPGSEQHKNATRHLRDLIECEVYYPTNMLGVLRELPPAALAAIEEAFERMRSEREALAARRAVLEGGRS